MPFLNDKTTGQSSLSFQKAAPTRTFQDIARQIEEAIISGELKPHDRLPSERELQQLFGVGRASVREAVRILESNGMLEVRTGAVSGGIFVKPLTTSTTVDGLQRLFLLEQISEKELIEYRVAIESITVFWAATRATDKDIQEIEQIIEIMEKESNWKQFHDADLEFHLAVARAAKNRINILVMLAIRHTLLRIMQEAFANVMERTQVRDTIIEEHKKTLRAIKQRDADKAKELMTYHITNFYNNAAKLE
jgi:DNA-binding FadR family transcriptional regulator